MTTQATPKQHNPLTVDLQWNFIKLRKASKIKDTHNIDFSEADNCPSLPSSLFQLHRFIEKAYQHLPWPSKIKQIGIYTCEAGGMGDISAAAKVINLMQGLSSGLRFDWVLSRDRFDARSFLRCVNPSVTIRTALNSDGTSSTLSRTFPLFSKGWQVRGVNKKVDFLVVGPVMCIQPTTEIETNIRCNLEGPRVDFVENAAIIDTNSIVYHAHEVIANSPDNENVSDLYLKVHSLLFPAQVETDFDLVMGLKDGSGVFLDESRYKAPLSREYCCPTYLLQLKDQTLLKDILVSMKIFDGKSLPDYDQYSLNFGYAHKPNSWGKFIDFVVLHEQEKNVVIILNQKGEFEEYSTEDFSDQVFSWDRMDFLENAGYGTVMIKGNGGDPVIIKQLAKDGSKQLTIIIRPSFLPCDMRCLQLASERLLATGDNSAAEAWAARCRLYLYEDVGIGFKKLFLQQQIALANKISPDVANVLSLFDESRNGLLQTDMSKVAEILNKPTLSQDTLLFCRHIIQNHSFKEVLEGSLKRAAWHHCIPDLMEEEGEVIDDTFKSGILGLFQKGEKSVQEIKNLPLLNQRIQLKVHEFLKKDSQ